jgi:DNA (cytosine-5)-methyltransferase 1
MGIPIVDIFAGPGGLGEGFTSYFDQKSKERKFKIILSIEKDECAHKTLTLRSFFRQFSLEDVPIDYYDYLSGRITLDELYFKWPIEADRAKNESWLAKLGDDSSSVTKEVVDNRIKEGLKGEKDWLLIGGPPCQAYSVVGRSRRQEIILDEKKDIRVGLYKQYLRILAVHNPAVFIMENVKGLLSAKTEESPIFSKILKDLSDPVYAYLSEENGPNIELNCPGYRIYSVVIEPKTFDEKGNPIFKQKDFIIHTESYGVPQTRHRVILLGIRNGIDIQPEVLKKQAEIPIKSVISGLPKLRSSLSKARDDAETWKTSIRKILIRGMLFGIDSAVKHEIIKQLEMMTLPKEGKGGEYIHCNENAVNYCQAWYVDKNLRGVCNHVSRGHMESDLLRYFFAACFAKVKRQSPKLEDFPQLLLPAHKNVKASIKDNKFADRFRVQLIDMPSKTVTSHISKDGHYFIHPDPTQCRSFTVREAARIQTFPDNYFFCGPRTSQFNQVGNAVPPLLANKIAGIVYNVFNAIPHLHAETLTSKIPESING